MALTSAPPAVPAQATPYPPRREGQKYIELPLQPLASMAVPYIVTAVLAEHDLGQFQRSALLWEQMRRDDRVAATMSVRINALMGLEHAFKPPPGVEETDATTAAAETLASVWDKFATPPDRVQILSWALGVGFAFGRLEWEMSATEWVPKLEVWHPSFVTWRSEELRYYVSTANRSQVPITPGEDGWWLWAPFGFKRGWTFGYVHQLAMPWLARSWSYRDWCRYNEIHGLPMVKAFTPANAQVDDEDRYLQELANRASSPVVRLPRAKDGTPAYDFELVEAKADTWAAFQGMKNDSNVDIAVAVLGQNLTTEVQGGSFAAAKVQDRVRGDILDADARAFEDFFNRSVVAPYAAFNLPGTPEEQPRLRFQTQETADLLKLGQGLQALGDGISKTKAAGVQLDVDEVTKRADVPTSGPAEDPEPPPAPPVPPQAGGFQGTQRAPGQARQLVMSEGADGRSADARATQEQGQAYADAIVSTFTKGGARALNEDRLRVLSIILESESYEEMQALLEKAYAEMDPGALEELVQAAIELARLNGMDSARGT